MLDVRGFRSLATALGVSLLASAEAGVLVVDVAGSPGTFGHPQAAVIAAVDGDVILVRPGDYSASLPIEIIDRSLTIVADPPGSTVITTHILVSGLSAAKAVVIRGLDVVGSKTLPTTGAGVTASLCLGSVLVEDCELEGGVGGVFFNAGQPGEPGLWAAFGSSITAVRCTLRGGIGYPGSPQFSKGPGGPGAQASFGSSIALFDCAAFGNSPADSVHAGHGAVVLHGSTGMISGCTLIGGDAVPGCAYCAGGFGLQINADSTVRWIDSTFVAGTGAISSMPVQAPPGTVNSWPGQARSWTLESPVQELKPAAVDVAGVQGDTVLFFWSPQGDHLPVGGVEAWMVLGSPLLGPFVLGTITNSDGRLALSIPAPPLVPAILDAYTFHMQPVFVNGAQVVAGAPSAFTLLR
jgi:hypothetical protein